MTWAVFKVKETGKKFGVINVHMDSFDDHGEGTGAVEAAAQVELMMKVAGEIYSQYSCPVLVGGDMNTTISEPTCRTLTQNGFADVQGIATVSDYNKGYFHGVKNMEYNEGISGAFFTGSAQTNDNDSESVDHIFISEYARTALECKQFDILADASVSSFADHCGMVFDFNIK
jgi:endonuclease/exonuclease/phosphatase family metal-dependent hydrolase